MVNIGSKTVYWLIIFPDLSLISLVCSGQMTTVLDVWYSQLFSIFLFHQAVIHFTYGTCKVYTFTYFLLNTKELTIIAARPQNIPIILEDNHCGSSLYLTKSRNIKHELVLISLLRLDCFSQAYSLFYKWSIVSLKPMWKMHFVRQSRNHNRITAAQAPLQWHRA